MDFKEAEYHNFQEGAIFLVSAIVSQGDWHCSQCGDHQIGPRVRTTP